MIVMESIGFSATHTIASILGDVPGFRVTHGSQNFDTGGAIGTGSQTPPDFVASMVTAKASGQTPVAIHTNMDPRVFHPACHAGGVRYRLLVRKPDAQIDSCYAWSVKKVMDGDPNLLLTALKATLNWFPGAGVASNLPNILFAYSVMHVCQFNMVALETGAGVTRMEELLNDEAMFRTVFNVPDQAHLDHFEGQTRSMASHRSKAGIDALAAPDKAAILAGVPISSGGEKLAVADLAKMLGY